jgi:hypothetical protein
MGEHTSSALAAGQAYVISGEGEPVSLAKAGISDSDVPDGMPSSDAGTQALAAHAVKFLLRALVDHGSDGNKMRYAKAFALEAVRTERGYEAPDRFKNFWRD